MLSGLASPSSSHAPPPPPYSGWWKRLSARRPRLSSSPINNRLSKIVRVPTSWPRWYTSCRWPKIARSIATSVNSASAVDRAASHASENAHALGCWRSRYALDGSMPADRHALLTLPVAASRSMKMRWRSGVQPSSRWRRAGARVCDSFFIDEFMAFLVCVGKLFYQILQIQGRGVSAAGWNARRAAGQEQHQKYRTMAANIVQVSGCFTRLNRYGAQTIAIVNRSRMA